MSDFFGDEEDELRSGVKTSADLEDDLYVADLIGKSTGWNTYQQDDSDVESEYDDKRVKVIARRPQNMVDDEDNFFNEAYERKARTSSQPSEHDIPLRTGEEKLARNNFSPEQPLDSDRSSESTFFQNKQSHFQSSESQMESIHEIQSDTKNGFKVGANEEISTPDDDVVSDVLTLRSEYIIKEKSPLRNQDEISQRPKAYPFHNVSESDSSIEENIVGDQDEFDAVAASQSMDQKAFLPPDRTRASSSNIDQTVHDQSMNNSDFFETASEAVDETDEKTWVLSAPNTGRTVATDVLLEGFEEHDPGKEKMRPGSAFHSAVEIDKQIRRPSSSKTGYSTSKFTDYGDMRGTALKHQFKTDMIGRASHKNDNLYGPDDVSYSKVRTSENDMPLQTTQSSYAAEDYKNNPASFQNKSKVPSRPYSSDSVRKPARPTSSGGHPVYPRGVTLSKTFTKHAWAPRDADSLKVTDYDEDRRVVESGLRGSQVGIAANQEKEWHEHKAAVPLQMKDPNVGQSYISENYYNNIMSHDFRPTPGKPRQPSANVKKNVRIQNYPSGCIREAMPQFGGELLVQGSRTGTPVNGGKVQSTQSAKQAHRKPNQYKQKLMPTYVDEMLFGNPATPVDTRNPAVSHNARSQSADTKFTPDPASSRGQRTNSARDNRQRRYPKDVPCFKNTYVDESLFGARPAEPSFRAPWDQGGPSRKPYAFDATDYKNLEAKRKLIAASNKPRKAVWK